MRKVVLAVALVALSWNSAPPAVANVILYQTSFDADTTTTAQTLSSYPAFSYSGGSAREVRVTDGVLQLAPQGAGLNQIMERVGFSGDLVITADLGMTPGGPDMNTGLRIGGNNILFHPGYPGGAFRVEGPGGFSNQNMGFDPAGGDTLHHIVVSITAATGDFAVQLIDALQPEDVYNATFQNPGYLPGDSIGFVTHGYLGTGSRFARFDNLTVSTPIPEPNTALLLSLGLTGLAAKRRRSLRS